MGIRQPIGCWEWQPIVNTSGAGSSISLLHCIDVSASYTPSQYRPMVVASPGQLRGALIALSVPPGAGKGTRTFNLYKNGETVGAQLVFDENETQKSLPDYTLDCLPGDRLWWQVVNTLPAPSAASVLVAQWYYNTTPKTWWSSSNEGSIFTGTGGTVAPSFDNTGRGVSGERDYPLNRVALFTTKCVRVNWFGKVAIPAGVTLTFYLRVNWVTQASFTANAGETSGQWEGSVNIPAGSHFFILPKVTGGTLPSTWYFYTGAAFENVSDSHAVMRVSTAGVAAQSGYRWVCPAQCDYGAYTAENLVPAYVPAGMKVRGLGIRMPGHTYDNASRWYEHWIAQAGDITHFHIVNNQPGYYLGTYTNYITAYNVDHAEDFITTSTWERLSVRYNRSLGAGGAQQREICASIWIETSAVPAPDSCSPTGATAASTLDVTITGVNLGEVTAVSFGSGATVNSFTVDSDTQITVSITTGSTPGHYTITLTNPKGDAVLTDAFDVYAYPPQITSVSPSSGLQGAR